MPTAGKLAGALIFAGLAWLITELYAGSIPPDQSFGDYRLFASIVGLICGWTIMGPQTRREPVILMNTGLQTVLMTVVFCILSLSTYQMVISALRMLYDGPVDAVVGIFAFAVEYGKILAAPKVLGAIIAGGFAGGWLAGMIGRRLP